jgi:hypothetical protein
MKRMAANNFDEENGSQYALVGREDLQGNEKLLTRF